jgi:hypothetical protein
MGNGFNDTLILDGISTYHNHVHNIIGSIEVGLDWDQRPAMERLGGRNREKGIQAIRAKAVIGAVW